MIPTEKEKSPRFTYRGVMLDCCRHFFSTEEIKKIILQMSILKLNKFHWHLSNDQGFRIESKVFPELNEISSFRILDEGDPSAESGKYRAGDVYGGYYTQKEIRDVVTYAAARDVEVIPELEMPGHATAILAAHPELTCSGKPLAVASTFGIHERIFCAGNEQTYTFIERLIDEIAGLFDSRYFHIGGDEAPKAEWKTCKKCNAVMKAHGFQNYEQLQVYFTNRVISHLKKLGKTPIVWNESIAEDGLDECAVVQYWMEMAPGESYAVKEFSKGRKFILSNQCQFYCDYSYAETPLRATLGYEPNVKGNPVPPENVLGIEAPMWTEWTETEEDIEKMLYPRLLAVAECGWSEERDTDEFIARAKAFLQIPERNILQPMPWNEATISGDKALRMIVDKMRELSARHGKMAAKNGKTAKAVVPDGAPQIDPAVAAAQYMKTKMEAAYTDDDIKKVLSMLAEKGDGR